MLSMNRTPQLGLARSMLGMLLSAPTVVLAAGGHHAVDDAGTLSPGQCQVEAWLDRQSAGSGGLLHLGPACAIGPVELGLNIERMRAADALAKTTLGLQLKWASSLTEQLNVGLLAAANSEYRQPRQLHHLGNSLIVLVSWQTSDQWTAHLNLGRDFPAGSSSSGRAGLALEWAPDGPMSLVAERFREGGLNAWRLGGRWQLAPGRSLDLSLAGGPGVGPSARWSLGLNLLFDR